LKEKTALVICGALIALLLSVIVVHSVTTWNGVVNISISQNTNFHITNAAGAPLSSFSTSITTTGTHTYDFIILNDGNNAITLSMTPTSALPTGTTATWNVTFPQTIPLGSSIPVRLTITAEQSGTGSYSWTFESSAA